MAVPLTILTDPRDPAPRRTLALPPATSILRGAHAAGIDITATCGGRGRCTSCRVKFVTGTVPPPTIMDEIQLGDDQVREGYRLSCQCVPSEGVTVPTVAAAGGERVLAVERGDTAGMKFGLAVDIGTTSVVGTLIELESGEQLGSVSSLNPQAVFGGDLMSRIAFAQFHPGNLRKLHTRIVGLLNQHIEEICRQSGVLAKWIYKVVVVGNTCMHHLLLGIDPSYVGLAPYAPVMRHPLVLPARELFLKVAPEARVCLLPLVAGFVGADAVAVALATRIYESAEIRIAVDIGTNGEVLLGSRDRLWACSAPAGPALEGAQIRHGMRGALGAIDRVTVDDDIRAHTIGEADALGVCGSGLIDLIAGLLDAGVIDWTGLIQVEARDALPPKLAERVVMRGEERQVIVLRPGEAGARAEIVLNQDDVRQVQLAKGAIASGVVMLQHVAGVPDARVAELMLAGGFGNYVSIASALRIGLIPPLPVERIRYVGNAAALGAQLCLVSETERRRAESVAARIEHVSLAAHPDFERIFVEAMNFPPPV